jgi:hypothetical protein
MLPPAISIRQLIRYVVGELSRRMVILVLVHVWVGPADAAEILVMSDHHAKRYQSRVQGGGSTPLRQDSLEFDYRMFLYQIQGVIKTPRI